MKEKRGKIELKSASIDWIFFIVKHFVYKELTFDRKKIGGKGVNGNDE